MFFFLEIYIYIYIYIGGNFSFKQVLLKTTWFALWFLLFSFKMKNIWFKLLKRFFFFFHGNFQISLPTQSHIQLLLIFFLIREALAVPFSFSLSLSLYIYIYICVCVCVYGLEITISPVWNSEPEHGNLGVNTFLKNLVRHA